MKINKEQLLKEIAKIRKIYKNLEGYPMEIIVTIPSEDFDELHIRGYEKTKDYLTKEEGNFVIEIERDGCWDHLFIND